MIERMNEERSFDEVNFILSRMRYVLNVFTSSHLPLMKTNNENKYTQTDELFYFNFNIQCIYIERMKMLGKNIFKIGNGITFTQVTVCL